MDAPERATELKAIVVGVVAFLTALWGWVGWAVIIWLGCMMIDYASGTMAAKAAGEWSSAAAREGLWHKLGEVFAVLVAALCDIALHVVVNGTGIQIGIELPAMVTPVVLLWYIITELGSIAENAGKLGAPVPDWLKRSLKNYKDKLDHDRRSQDEEQPDEYDGKHDVR